MLLNKIINRIRLFLKRVRLKKIKVFIHSSSRIDIDTNFEGYTKINNNCIIKNSFIGKGTYIASNSAIYHAKIGRFCSIGSNVKCIIGNHPSNTFVSTHPAFFSLLNQAGFHFCSEQKFDDFKYVDKDKKYMFEIGNDVWMGEDARLMNGIKIGNGVIIAAGSLVINDVPNYSIVAGVPAKVIKMRFQENQIEILESFQWWNKSFIWLKNNKDVFVNIDVFQNKFKSSDN